MGLLDLFQWLILFLLLWLAYTRFKGAEYAPTTRKKAEKMIEFAKITGKDIVYDLGSGFGGLAIRAGKKSKRVVGIEYDFLRYLISLARVNLKGLKNIKIIRGDFFKQDWSDADVVFIYLKQKTNQKLKSRLERLKNGTRIVSNTWTFEKWKPVKKDNNLKVYSYIIGKSNKNPDN